MRCAALTGQADAHGSLEVLVIGAGPAGIACAYYLDRAGIRYRVVDQAAVIASTWASLYPSLRLNTTKWFSHLPDAPMPRHYWIFPTGRQYHKYLERYIARRQFNIRLGVRVTHVARDDALWRVETSAGTERVPCVILATGRFGNPHVPDIEGLNTFEGTVLHAHDYHGAEPFRGQRVMLVGNGPSGVDLAPEIGRVTSYPVLLAMRTGITLKPRYPLGLPKHLWMLLAERLPTAWGECLLAIVERQQFRNLSAVGIKTPAPGAVSQAAAARGPELIRAVRAGQVRCVDAPLRFYGRCAELQDGSVHELDTVILATGYRPTLYHYLDFPVTRGKDEWPLRDPAKDSNDVTNREIKDAPGLYLVGVFYQGKGALYNCNTEAEAAVQQIKQRLATLR